MKEEWKVFIRGVEDRGDEVLKILEEHGGKKYSLDGTDPECLYYITHEGSISLVLFDSEFGKIIMDNYSELHLPEKWKDGDILVNKNADYKFCVFDDYLSKTGSGNELFFFHCEVASHKGERYLKSNNRRYFHDVNDYRMATTQEVEKFHEALNMYHKDWDAEKKQVVDWKWKPNDNEEYYYILSDGKVRSCAWLDDEIDNSRFSIGNCFKTEEEAEAMAEKLKKLLKENHEKTKENS